MIIQIEKTTSCFQQPNVCYSRLIVAECWSTCAICIACALNAVENRSSRTILQSKCECMVTELPGKFPFELQRLRCRLEELCAPKIDFRCERDSTEWKMENKGTDAKQ